MSFMELARQIAAGEGFSTLSLQQNIEEALNRAYQSGLSAGHERKLQVNPDTLAQLATHLTARNAELHKDKHELRMRTCHRCGAYPEVP